VDYEDCIVTFIDVLGFRNLLETRSAAEIGHIIQKMEEFTRPENIGRSSNFNESGKRTHSTSFSQSVSDAIVRVRTYDTEYRDGALYWEVLDLLHAQIELVNSGVVVRGGLTVGKAHVGADGQGPIFGPAMARAFDLESKEAVYPRIIIDDFAMEEHRLSTEDEDFELHRLLASGDDGTIYIDYLNASEPEFDSDAAYLEFLTRHFSIVERGLQEFPVGSVRRKYIWLQNYHNRAVRSMIDRVDGSPKLQQDFAIHYDINAPEFMRALLVKTS
jgi:hypothetical protein